MLSAVARKYNSLGLVVLIFLLPFVQLQAQDKSEESVYELYLRLGDYYASRQENKKAADAYRQAAERVKHSYSEEMQIEISQRLVDVNATAAAINTLQAQCHSRQYRYDPCLLLARYLSWHNQPIAASKIGQQLLGFDSSDEDVLITQANALSWQGDEANALRLYEQLLGTRQSADSGFDIVLGYTQSLLATANYRAAYEAYTKLRPKNEFEQRVIDDLAWQFHREASPRFFFRTEQYDDIYDAGYTRHTLGLDVPFDASWLWLRTGSISSTDGIRKVELDHHQVGGMMRLHNRLQLSGFVGRALDPKGVVEPVNTGSLSISANLPQLWLSLSVVRELVDDSPYALENGILRESQELALNYQISDRWGLRLNGKNTDYSDDNHSLDASVMALYNFYFGPPKMSVGLKREVLAFDRQAGGGYFDPDQVMTNKLLLVISKSQDRFSAFLELFAGTETIERFGGQEENEIIGGYASFRFQFMEHAQLELIWEGANLAYGEPNAYRYYQTELNAYIYF